MTKEQSPLTMGDSAASEPPGSERRNHPLLWRRSLRTPRTAQDPEATPSQGAFLVPGPSCAGWGR